MSNNNFPKEARFIFQEAWKCWHCGKNHIDCLHHIMGRGGGSSDVERSILNAAPLNNFDCHINIHGKLRTEEKQREFLLKTRKYLSSYGYELNDIDRLFIKKYKELYET